MTRLRTTLLALGAGTAVVATGAVVASSAGATAADGSTGKVAARGWWAKLTDEQRTCLQDAKITRPVGPLDDAERAALRAKVEAAAKTCGVTLPFARARAFWNGLTDEQRQCLKDAGVNRPWGPLTKEQRQQVRADLRAAAEKCGVSVPTKAPATL